MMMTFDDDTAENRAFKLAPNGSIVEVRRSVFSKKKRENGNIRQ